MLLAGREDEGLWTEESCRRRRVRRKGGEVRKEEGDGGSLRMAVAGGGLWMKEGFGGRRGVEGEGLLREAAGGLLWRKV